MKKTLLAAAVAGLLLTGCSAKPSGPSVATAGSSDPKPVASLDKADANRQFARCMREHGVDMPDPGPDGNLQFDAGAGGDRDKAVQAASQCQQYLPSGGAMTDLSPEQLEQGRAFAKCMREHGIDMPDPDPGTGLSAILKGGIDFDSPAFKEATEACKGVVRR
ncbi:hypothetical protein [Dactylosporangium sp. CA-233914]|uniref:hypothetical protein n=1 Tax=Dactylosporangium sp. CA-233914 TaxID=3239934 RepID=UPI003D8EEB61